MKTIVTFTCLVCEAKYDKELDIDPDKAVKMLTSGTVSIGFCEKCGKRKGLDIEKEMEKYLKRHAKEFDSRADNGT